MNKFKNKSVILFDGVCNLCNKSVKFIIKRDSKNQFLFASLQSDAAKTLLLQYNITNSSLESIILLKQGQVYRRSTAALKILRELNGFWSILYLFIIIPDFLRDPVYNLIAKKRYHWFGRTEDCMVPTRALKAKFLE